MHKILEFQAVVLAGGRGSRLPDVGGRISKCLLPIGPYPVLWYSLHILEKMGFQETMLVVLDEDKSNIINSLEKCPLKIKYEIIIIPSDEDWGTADTLRHLSPRVVTDLIVISGDIITNVNMDNVLNLYRKHDASLVTVFFDNGPEEYIELPGPKTKSKPDRDLVGIDKETQRLVFVASASDFEENFTLPRNLLKKFNTLTMHSRLLDAHIYVMKKAVINFLVSETKLTTVKGELLPYIVKKQHCKPKTTSPADMKLSEKNLEQSDIYSFFVESGYESKIREMSAYNDHSTGKGEVYHRDVIRCYAYIPQKSIYGLRINTLSSFYLANNKILHLWEEITGSPLKSRLDLESDVRTKQIDEHCIVGDKTIVSEKTSIHKTFIGSSCVVGNKVRITNSILMNNATVKEGCVLQDCVVYTGATIENGCNLQHCLVGPHHVVAAGSIATHQLLAEDTDNMITLG